MKKTYEEWREEAIIAMWWDLDPIGELWLGDWYQPFD